MNETADTDAGATVRARVRLAGLTGGALIASAMLVMGHPAGIGADAWQVAAIALLMATWWMTEAVPLAATALLPLVLFPLIGIAPIEATAARYAHPLVFLFLGGFLLAQAMRRWGLSEHVALRILKLGGLGPGSVVASFMAATAFLSMWVSNTASAMIMLPIGLSIIDQMRAERGRADRRPVDTFATVLMLAIGYSATIGGMGTLVGSPPNALFASFMAAAFRVEVGFLDWMLFGVPLVLLLLPVSWFVLTRVMFRLDPGLRAGAQHIIGQRLAALGPLDRSQRILAGLLIGTVACWLTLPLIKAMMPELGLTDVGIALTAALCLFLLPGNSAERRRLLTWSDAQAIRWDILILFGGGIALAQAIGGSGLAQWIGQTLSVLGALPLTGLLLAMALLVVLVGELASNTAIAATLLPVAGSMALAMGVDPVTLTLPVALAASVGFMLPVATPPNAIVYGSGAITPGQMVRAGFLLDIVGVVMVVAVSMALGRWALG